VGRMCGLAGVSRAAYYRAWASSEPLREETALRDVIQRLALANRHYGYRRIGALLRREGWCVNHKRVVRIMREDNLLCLAKPLFRPPTTDARHSWRVWPNLARHLMPMATNQLWVADLTYVRLARPSSTWPSCWTRSAARLSAGRWPTTCGRAWPWMRLRWHWLAARWLLAAWSTTRTAAFNPGSTGRRNTSLT
jgi:hypothetical protein